MDSHGIIFPWMRLAFGVAAILVVMMLAAGLGSVSIPPLVTAKILLSRMPLVEIPGTWPESWDIIIMQLRLPRITLAALVGSALALSGATYQGMFRNPLADPYLIGVASGAGLGATIVLVTGVPERIYWVSLLPVAAFIGAVVAVTISYTIARTSENLPLTTLVLAGVAIGFLASAITVLLMLRSDADLRPVFTWLLGGLISSRWEHSLFILPYVSLGTVTVIAYARTINVLQLGEEHAGQIGVDTERAKLVLIGAATLLAAAAVSFSGLIGFVGLIAPHAVRLVWGVDYRTLLPMAAIVGAAFLIFADLVARTVVSPSELPVGVVTSFCGAPFFLYLLRRRRGDI